MQLLVPGVDEVMWGFVLLLVIRMIVTLLVAAFIGGLRLLASPRRLRPATTGSMPPE